MAEYMSKELFLGSMGLSGDETKYGNRDAEHQHRSYSTYMSYEIVDSIKDSIVEDVAPVRHGEWIDGCCSNCGEESLCTENSPTHEFAAYCPNCGAKMDG